MAIKPRISEPDDKPVLNIFGLPVICDDNADLASDPCCEPCSDWMYCLLQTFYTVDIPDPIEFQNWLADHWLDGNVQHKAEQGALFFSAAAGSPTAIFEGTFLAEPPNQDITAQACEFPQRADACDHTHRIRHERTVLTNSSEANLVKRFGLNVNTECVQIGEDKFLKFTLNLVWLGHVNVAYYEPPIGYDVDEETDLGIYCPPKPRTPWDADAQEVEWYCCPIAVSDLIDVTTIASLADLAAVVLNKLPPATSSYDYLFYGVWAPDNVPNQRCLQSQGTWACTVSSLMIGCEGGLPVCLYFAHDVCPYTVNGINAESYWPWPIGEDCDTNASGEDLCTGEITGCTWLELNGGTETPGSGTCDTSACISRPLEFGLGDIVLSVIDNKCRVATDCKSCFPDPESPIAIPIKPGDVRFATDSASSTCSKIFYIVKPDCLTVDKVYWSDGAITLGAATHTVVIDNIDPLEPLRLRQKVSALILMTNGCYYCWEETFSCGCCEGVSGSISIATDPEGGCEFTITANVTTTLECPNAFIEFQVIQPGEGGPCDLAEFPHCECEQVVPGNTEDPPCPSYNSCTFGLSDGESVVFTITGEARVRYRIVDGPCGCASDWLEFPIVCAVCPCCIGTIIGVSVTITGWGDGGSCPACASVNRTYYLHQNPGSGCLWGFTTVDPEDAFAIFCCSEVECYGVEIFLTIGCPADEIQIDLGINAGGGATWLRTITGVPGDCTELNGSLAAYLVSNTNGACNTDFANATLDLEFA